jgi:hypothetical protein
MGHQVVYCCKCNIKLTQDLFDSQQAYYFEDKTYCKGCILKQWSALPKGKQDELWKKVTAAPPDDSPPAPVETKPPSRRVVVVSKEDGGSKMWVAVAAVVLVAVVGIVVVAMTRRPSPPRQAVKPVPPPTVEPPPLVIPPPPPPPKDALDLAREYRSKNPNDLAGQIQKFRDAAFELDKTPRADEAKKELVLTLEVRSRQWAEEFREIERRADRADSFKAALDIVRQERARHAEGEWTSKCDAKSKEIEQRAADQFRPLKEEARRGDRATFERIRKQVESWGLDSLLVELDAVKPAELPTYEFVFGVSSLKGAAQFSQVEYPGIGKAWTCQTDLNEKQRHENYVEWEFQAQAGIEYQCHMYVGGCCQESIGIFWQCSELTRVNSKQEKVSLEPGQELYLARKASAASAHLPKMHADHPKAPSFWEWRTLESPIFASAGVKKFRLLTKAKGFSVAYVVISAKHKNPPQSLEHIKALLRE